MNFREVRSKSLALEAVSCIPPDEQVAELPLLGVAVKRHSGHAVSAAVGGALAGSEGGAPAECHVSRVTCNVSRVTF